MALHFWYDTEVPVIFVKEAEFDSWKHAIALLWKELCADLPPGPVHTPTKVPDPPDAVDGAPDDDIRILPIQIDAADNRRHCPIKDAQPLFIEDGFEDRPLDRDRTMMHAARELRRSGLTFSFSP